MKRTLLVSLCVLAMASVSFGAGEITFDFEGSDPVGVNNGWGTIGIVEGYATTGTHSLMVEKGGWGPAFNFNDSAEIKNALATVGKITLDLTTDAATFPAAWGSLGVFMQGSNVGWNVYQWADSQFVVGSSQTITFQLSAEEMANVAASSWFQVGIATNAPDAIAEVLPVYDEITGELLVPGTPGMTPTWYFDNVQIVPEPATLVLLGIGAFSLIRRKR